MSKNAWITIVVIIVVILLGWIIYSATDKDNMEEGANATTTTTSADDNVTINNFPAGSATASSGATGLVSSPIPVKTNTIAVTVHASNYKFDVGNIDAKEGDTVNLTVINDNGTHDLKVEGYNAGTRTLNSGESQTISFVANKLGDYQYYCSVGNHRAMGMVGTLHVTGR